MADIDQILAGGAGSSSRADFSALADIPEAFWKGRDRRYVQEGRDLFKGGVPTNADGSIDYGAMRDALFKHGDVGQGVGIDNLDIQRQQLKFGQQQSQGITNFEGGGQPQPILPPSANRSAQTTVAPPLNRGGVQQPQNGAPGGTNILQILTAQGIPNDQLGPASASIARQLGVDDPTQPIDTNDPRVRNVLVPAIQQLKRAGVGNIIPAGQPSPPPQVLAQPGGVPPSGAPQSGPPQPAPQPPPQAQPGPVTNAVTGTAAPAVPSRTDQAIAFYAGIMSNPVSPKNNVDLAKSRLESLQKNTEVTPEQKNYIQAVTQGYKGTMADFAVKTEADKAYVTDSTKSFVKKYDSIQTAGDRARVDMPELELARKLTEDPNFYSGVGEKYNLLVKRALVALGGDENTAAPQEAFRKIVSTSIIDQIKGMAGTGTGQIRNAEIKIMRDAAASTDNTPQSNRLLLELSYRLQKRAAAVADMAQNYNGGRLDAGFDRQVAAYDRANPMVSDKEIPNFRKIIDGGAKVAQPPVPNAKQAPDGNWYTPDPARPGKYLRVSEVTSQEKVNAGDEYGIPGRAGPERDKAIEEMTRRYGPDVRRWPYKGFQKKSGIENATV